MSHKLIIPRLNCASNFNFFYKNTKKNFLVEQNFIANHLLTSTYRRLITGPQRKTKLESENNSILNASTSKESGIRECLKGFTLENVATKVLSCQEPEAELSQKILSSSKLTSDFDSHSKVPFEVTPKITRSEKQGRTQTRRGLRSMVGPYLKLTKPNLTVLVTLSSICSYAISPYSVSLPQLLFLTMGTALCSGAANAINMGREPEFDAKMARTAGRPVVRGLITPKQSFQFAAATSSLGCTMLYFGVNPTVALLGLLNIVLYSWIYTSLKRKSIINTWVGAIVGAIPPLMGWAASSTLTHPAGWCLAGLLYAWQFPHFNALSHNVASQYKSAGYVMAAAEYPMLNARVALRYSLLMFPLCFGLTYFGITDWVFQFDSAVVNTWLAYLAFNFWRQQNRNYASGGSPTTEGISLANFHAKKLFWCSVWHLPAVLILAMLHKKGQWDRLFIYLGIKSPSNGTSSDSKRARLETI